MELKLTVFLPPSINHYLNMKIVRMGKRLVPRVYESKEARDYKENLKRYVEQEVKKQNWKMGDKTQHYYCDCVFYFDRVDKDCGNYFKVLLDGITETQKVWHDDNVVCERVHRIYYDKDCPRIEIVIRPVEYVGIFASQDEADIFENKCKSCKRYKRNCSILRKAKEGKIQPEIGNECEKYKEVNS